MSAAGLVGLSYGVLLLIAIYATYRFTDKYKTTKFKAEGEEIVNKKILQMVDQQNAVRKECDDLREQLRRQSS